MTTQRMPSLDQIAKEAFGQNVKVRDPRVFRNYVQKRAQEYSQQQPAPQPVPVGAGLRFRQGGPQQAPQQAPAWSRGATPLAQYGPAGGPGDPFGLRAQLEETKAIVQQALMDPRHRAIPSSWVDRADEWIDSRSDAEWSLISPLPKTAAKWLLRGIQESSSPVEVALGLGIAKFGPKLAARALNLPGLGGKVGRVVGSVAQPIVSGPLKQRIGAELAANVAGAMGARAGIEHLPQSWPGWSRGLAGGGAGVMAPLSLIGAGKRVLPAIARGAEAVAPPVRQALGEAAAGISRRAEPLVEPIARQVRQAQVAISPEGAPWGVKPVGPRKRLPPRRKPLDAEASLQFVDDGLRPGETDAQYTARREEGLNEQAILREHLSVPGNRIRLQDHDDKSVIYEVAADGALQRSPWRGPEVGVPNLKAAERTWAVATGIPDNVKRGRRVMIDRIGLEMRKGNIPEEEADRVVRFITGMPDEVLADIGTSYVQTRKTGVVEIVDPDDPYQLIAKPWKDLTKAEREAYRRRNAPTGQEETGIAGEFDPTTRLLTFYYDMIESGRGLARGQRSRAQALGLPESRIFQRLTNAELEAKGWSAEEIDEMRHALENPDGLPRTFIHEIMHGASEFVPPSDMRLLEKQFRREFAAAARPEALEGPWPRSRAQYRYENFAEWFAEVMSDRVRRDMALSTATAAEKSALKRAYERMRKIAIGLYNHFRRIGDPDTAERVYRDLIAGRRSTRRSPIDIRERGARPLSSPEMGGYPGPPGVIQTPAEAAVARGRPGEVELVSRPRQFDRPEVLPGEDAIGLQEEPVRWEGQPGAGRPRPWSSRPAALAPARGEAAQAPAPAPVPTPVTAGEITAPMALRAGARRVGVQPETHSASPRDFVGGEYLDPDVSAAEEGIWHVTTAKGRVYAEGLKPRQEVVSVGLGGGYSNQAPDRISATFDEGQATVIADRLRLAIRAARGEASSSEVLDDFLREYRLDDEFIPGDLVEALGAPERAGANWDSFNRWIAGEYGDDAYRLLQELDDALPRVFTGAETFGYRVGLTAPKRVLAGMDPDQVEVLQIAARRDAKATHIEDEAELRFAPEDVWVIDRDPTAPTAAVTPGGWAIEDGRPVYREPAVSGAGGREPPRRPPPESPETRPTGGEPPEPPTPEEASIRDVLDRSSRYNAASLSASRNVVEREAVDDLLDSTILKVEAAVEMAEPLTRQEIEALQKAERRRRTAAAIGAAAGQDPLTAGKAAKGQLGGELPNPRFEAIRGQFTEAELRSLFDAIRLNQVQDMALHSNAFFDRMGTDTALNKLLSGEVPNPSELALLEGTFGSRLVDRLRAQRSLGERGTEMAIDILGIPKTLRSTLDVSGFLRQGGVLAPRRRKEFLEAGKQSFRAMFSEEAALDIDAGMRADPVLDLLTDVNRKVKLSITDISKKGIRGLDAREEQFASKMLNRMGKLSIPIRASERHYVTFLNNFRYRIAKNTLINWQKAGIEVTDEMIDGMNGWINASTGRTELVPKKITWKDREIHLAGPLNVVFWSPQLVISRFETLGKYATAMGKLGLDRTGAIHLDPAARLISQEIAKDMTAFVATGITLVSMAALAAKAAPGVFEDMSVERDPRSSDFGKMRIGATRIDPWAGFQPVARYIAQGMTGQRKTISTGEISPTDRKAGKDAGRVTRAIVGADDTIGRFLRSKLAPGISTMIAAEVASKTFTGDKLNDEQPLFAAGASTFLPDVTVDVRTAQLIEQFVPLILMDFDEAIAEQGLAGGFLAAAPALVGIGSQTFGRRRGQAPAGFSFAHQMAVEPQPRPERP